MNFELLSPETYQRSAYISSCGKYRYSLSRVWDRELPRMYWVMLNPSTADEKNDDPTIRKTIGFARRHNYGSIEVLNVSPYCATDPRELTLLSSAELAGSAVSEISAFLSIPADGVVVAAWGMNPYKNKSLLVRMTEVRKMLPKNIYCVKQSSGRPWHPLYVAYGPIERLIES